MCPCFCFRTPTVHVLSIGSFFFCSRPMVFSSPISCLLACGEVLKVWQCLSRSVQAQRAEQRKSTVSGDPVALLQCSTSMRGHSRRSGISAERIAEKHGKANASLISLVSRRCEVEVVGILEITGAIKACLRESGAAHQPPRSNRVCVLDFANT